jgi:NhaP-type Na+/H+ or K+/H+ antiporter
MNGVDINLNLQLKEHLSILLVSLLFILLASRLEGSTFKEIGWDVLLVFLLSSLGSELTMRECNLLALIAPHGIKARRLHSASPDKS